MGDTSSPNSEGLSTARREGGSGQRGSSLKTRRHSSTKALGKSKSDEGKKSKERKPSHSLERSQSSGPEMELLTQRQNGSVSGLPTEELEADQQEGKKEQTATIKGLWKKAFKSLKSGDQKLSAKKSGSLKRRDSKEVEEPEPEESKEIDPVYSLLKCAADLPRVVRPSKDTSCSGLLGRHGDSSGSTSKASSPSSSGVQGSSSPCASCGCVHEIDILQGLGSDFKQFYKLTSPIKRGSSADLSN